MSSLSWRKWRQQMILPKRPHHVLYQVTTSAASALPQSETISSLRIGTILTTLQTSLRSWSASMQASWQQKHQINSSSELFAPMHAPLLCLSEFPLSAKPMMCLSVIFTPSCQRTVFSGASGPLPVVKVCPPVILLLCCPSNLHIWRACHTPIG